MKRNVLSKQEILRWSKKYDEDHPWWVKRESEVRNRLKMDKELSKDDLIRIIEWKFKELKGRRVRVTKYAKETDDSVLRKVSRLVFGLDKKYDNYKLDLLGVFDGIGVALASVILTFYDPENYGVFDIHVWRELYGKEPKNLFTTKNCQRLLFELRRIGTKYRLPARTVEKAHFKKNLDEEENTKENP